MSRLKNFFLFRFFPKASPRQIDSVPVLSTGFVRGVDYVRWGDAWARLDDVLREIGRRADTAWLVSLFTHHSGYVREAAIRQCSGSIDAVAIEPLIDRLNDWVPGVRAAALMALRGRLVNANAALIVSLLPRFRGLQNRKRDQHDLIVAEIESFLLQPQNIAEAVNGLQSSDLKVARECYRLIVEANAQPLAECARYAVRSRDLVIAATAMGLAVKMAEPERSALIDEGLRSPFTPVRSAALLALLRSPSERKLTTARMMLFDRQSTVREIACGWLSEQGESPGQHYAAVLQDQESPPYKIRSALWAAAKLRLSSATPAVRALLTAFSPRIRSAAILTMAKLDPASVPQLVRLALSDASPATNKVTILLVRYHDAVISYADLEPLRDRQDRQDVALRIAGCMDKWDWLACIFDVALSAVPLAGKSGNKIDRELQDWLSKDNSGFSNPDSPQSERLGTQIRRGVLHKLGWKYTEQIAFVLKCSGVAPGEGAAAQVASRRE